MQDAFNAASQWFGSAPQNIAQVQRTVERTGQQLGRWATEQAKAVERSAPVQEALRSVEQATGVAWRAGKTLAPVLARANPVAPLAEPLVEALARTPVAAQLARTPVAQAIQGLDRKFSGDPAAAPMATRAEFLNNVKPQDRAEVAATARQIVAAQRQVLGDGATEIGADASKSLFQAGLDRARWVFTGHGDHMDRLLGDTGQTLDRLQRDVLAGKIGASEARRELAATMKDYSAEYVRVQNARVGQYDVGIAALQGVRRASETVVTMTATTVAGPAGGVAVGSVYRDVNKAAYEWSAGAHGVAAPRESLIRYGIDVARGEKADARTGQQVLTSFGQGVLSSAADTAVARFSVGRTTGLLQGGTFAAGRTGTIRAAAVAQTEAQALFRAPLAVGQAAVEAAQNPDMTLQQKAQYVGKAALGEVASLPFTYLGAGLGIHLDSGRTAASAARQMVGDAVTGLADQATRTGVFEGRTMTPEELAGTFAGTAVGGLNNFSQHPHAATAAAEAANGIVSFRRNIPPESPAHGQLTDAVTANLEPRTPLVPVQVEAGQLTESIERQARGSGSGPGGSSGGTPSTPGTQTTDGAGTTAPPTDATPGQGGATSGTAQPTTDTSGSEAHTAPAAATSEAQLGAADELLNKLGVPRSIDPTTSPVTFVVASGMRAELIAPQESLYRRLNTVRRSQSEPPPATPWVLQRTEDILARLSASGLHAGGDAPPLTALTRNADRATINPESGGAAADRSSVDSPRGADALVPPPAPALTAASQRDWLVGGFTQGFGHPLQNSVYPSIVERGDAGGTSDVSVPPAKSEPIQPVGAVRLGGAVRPASAEVADAEGAPQPSADLPARTAGEGRPKADQPPVLSAAALLDAPYGGGATLRSQLERYVTQSEQLPSAYSGTSPGWMQALAAGGITPALARQALDGNITAIYDIRRVIPLVQAPTGGASVAEAPSAARHAGRAAHSFADLVRQEAAPRTTVDPSGFSIRNATSGSRQSVPVILPRSADDVIDVSRPNRILEGPQPATVRRLNPADSDTRILHAPSLSYDASTQEGLGREAQESGWSARSLLSGFELSGGGAAVAYATPHEVPAGVVGMYQMAGLPWSAYPGLKFLPLNTISPAPLSETLNRGLAPDGLQRLQAFDPTHTYYFMGTPAETTLTRSLGAEDLSSPAAVNDRLGTKEGSRNAFVAAKVPHPPGTVLERSVDDLSTRLAELLQGLDQEGKFPARVVIKLNDGASGEGNADLRVAGLQEHVGAPDFAARVKATIESETVPVNKNWTWSRFAEDIPRLGALAEVFVPGKDKTSPSVQVDIRPDGSVQVASTHEQILDGQIYVGASFPADEIYRARLQEYGQRVGEYLREQGARGRFAIDFVAAWETTPEGGRTLKDLQAIEINLREGGTTHPQRTMSLMFPAGELGPDGVFRATPGGAPVEYSALDKFHPGTGDGKERRVVGLTPDDVSDVLATRGGPDGTAFGVLPEPLLFNPVTGRGTVGHVLSSVQRWGRMGIQFLGADLPELTDLHRRTDNAFNAATALMPRKPAPQSQWPALTGQELGGVRIERNAGVPAYRPAVSGESTGQLQGADWLRTAVPSPDGSRIASAVHTGGEYQLQFWNRATGQREPLTLVHDTPIRDIQYHGDSIITATAGGHVAGFDPNTGKTQFEVAVHDNLINAVRRSPDGQSLLTGSFDGTVAVTNARSGAVERYRIGHVVRDVAWASDGQSFFAASTDGKVRQISAVDAMVKVGDREVRFAKGDVIAEYAGHPDGAKAIALSPDERRLAVTAVDGSVQIWDRGNAERPVVRVEREWLSGAPVFSNDGQNVFFASQDGTVRVLPLGSTPADTDLMQINQVVGPVHVRPMADGSTEVTAFSGSGEFKSVVLEPPAADQPTGRGFRPSGDDSPAESKKK